MRYEGRIFRPPSEARSLIIQCTVGCSHNKCTFCSMYKEKQFHLRSLEDVFQDLADARSFYPNVKRIFLADGDALILKTSQLIQILDQITHLFPECQRVGIYGSPRSILLKSEEELCSLRRRNLGIVYLGLESGNEEILRRIHKGETASQIVVAGQKVRAAGIALSVTVISGMGGQENTEAHALDSASALSQMKPDYLGLLTLMVEPRTPLWEEVQAGSFCPLRPEAVAEETILLLKHLDAEGCIFRSNHISNYIPLAGTLNRDKDRIIADVRLSMEAGLDPAYEGFRHL